MQTLAKFAFPNNQNRIKLRTQSTSPIFPPGLRRTARPCTRTVPFLVVPGRSWNEHDQKSYLERNDPEQGTTDFEKNGNEGKYLERGRARNEVVPGYEHSTGTGFFEWERRCARTCLWISEWNLQWYRKIYRRFPYDFQTRISRVIERSTGDFPMIFRLESSEL